PLRKRFVALYRTLCYRSSGSAVVAPRYEQFLWSCRFESMATLDISITATLLRRFSRLNCWFAEAGAAWNDRLCWANRVTRSFCRCPRRYVVSPFYALRADECRVE